MTLVPEEFMRRFLLHVLPAGFHRIRHYGLLANGARTNNLALGRTLLDNAPAQSAHTEQADSAAPCFVCRRCGAPMLIVEIFLRGQTIRTPPQALNTSCVASSIHSRPSPRAPQPIRIGFALARPMRRCALILSSLRAPARAARCLKYSCSRQPTNRDASQLRVAFADHRSRLV